jgi:hypothetical protein
VPHRNSASRQFTLQCNCPCVNSQE